MVSFASSGAFLGACFCDAFVLPVDRPRPTTRVHMERRLQSRIHHSRSHELYPSRFLSQISVPDSTCSVIIARRRSLLPTRWIRLARDANPAEDDMEGGPHSRRAFPLNHQLVKNLFFGPPLRASQGRRFHAIPVAELRSLGATAFWSHLNAGRMGTLVFMVTESACRYDYYRPVSPDYRTEPRLNSPAILRCP